MGVAVAAGAAGAAASSDNDVLFTASAFFSQHSGRCTRAHTAPCWQSDLTRMRNLHTDEARAQPKLVLSGNSTASIRPKRCWPGVQQLGAPWLLAGAHEHIRNAQMETHKAPNTRGTSTASRQASRQVETLADWQVSVATAAGAASLTTRLVTVSAVSHSVRSSSAVSEPTHPPPASSGFSSAPLPARKIFTHWCCLGC